MFQVPEGAWLVMLDYEVDSDTREERYLYVAYDPQTGKTVQSPLSMPQQAEDGEIEWETDPLQISADYQWSLHDVEASDDVRDSGIVPIYRLGDGSRRTLDLREITGNIRLEPLQLIFDGTDPNILHVGTSSGAVWTVNIQKRSATKSDARISDPSSKEDNYYWRFAADGSGRIVEGKPHPDGGPPHYEDETHLPGAKELSATEEDELPELPENPDEVVRTSSGAVMALTVESGSPPILRGYRYPANAAPSDDWKRLQASSPLPQSNDMSINYVRPPL